VRVVLTMSPRTRLLSRRLTRRRVLGTGALAAATTVAGGVALAGVAPGRAGGRVRAEGLAPL